MAVIQVKEGEKYILHCCSHDVGSDRSQEFVAEYDMTDLDLDEEARIFMEESLQPEWWYTIPKKGE